jgi:hypothetical protein
MRVLRARNGLKDLILTGFGTRSDANPLGCDCPLIEPLHPRFDILKPRKAKTMYFCSCFFEIRSPFADITHPDLRIGNN